MKILVFVLIFGSLNVFAADQGVDNVACFVSQACSEKSVVTADNIATALMSNVKTNADLAQVIGEVNLRIKSPIDGQANYANVLALQQALNAKIITRNERVEKKRHVAVLIGGVVGAGSVLWYTSKKGFYSGSGGNNVIDLSGVGYVIGGGLTLGAGVVGSGLGDLAGYLYLKSSHLDESVAKLKN